MTADSSVAARVWLRAPKNGAAACISITDKPQARPSRRRRRVDRDAGQANARAGWGGIAEKIQASS